MNIITLVPTRNEEKNIGTFLENASKFSDYIIVADQTSTDRTVEIALSFPKVKVISNNEKGHGNHVRWLLLDEARKISGNNMIVAIDADEMISPTWFSNVKKKYENESVAKAFSFPWIQLWKSTNEYRCDGVWKNSSKTAVWIDDRITNYEKVFVLNDHTSRVPEKLPVTTITEYPLLHFQFVTLKQTDYKQVWYRMHEFLAGRKAQDINYRYAQSKDSPNVALKKVDPMWFNNISLPVFSDLPEDSWHRREILDLFEHYGVEYFESLDIWYIEELKEKFVKKMERDPKIKEYFWLLIALNKLQKRVLNKTRFLPK